MHTSVYVCMLYACVCVCVCIRAYVCMYHVQCGPYLWRTHTYVYACTHTDRPVDRQTDRQTDRQSDHRQIDYPYSNHDLTLHLGYCKARHDEYLPRPLSIVRVLSNLDLDLDSRTQIACRQKFVYVLPSLSRSRELTI